MACDPTRVALLFLFAFFFAQPLLLLYYTQFTDLPEGWTCQACFYWDCDSLWWLLQRRLLMFIRWLVVHFTKDPPGACRNPWPATSTKEESSETIGWLARSDCGRRILFKRIRVEFPLGRRKSLGTGAIRQGVWLCDCWRPGGSIKSIS